MAKKATLPKQSGPNLKGFYILLAAVAVIGLGWIGWSVTNRGGGAALDPVPLTDIADTEALLRQAEGVSIGSTAADAPPVLVFSDFTCPACRIWVQLVEPQLKQEYVQTGLIRYVYYDFPLGGQGQHRYGFLAARAARCANEQGKFWEFHDLLFGRQGEWSYARRPPVEEFVEYSRMLSMDADAFEACVDSDKYADVVTANRVLGDQLGVGGTPTVFVGGRQVAEWSNYEAVKALVAREVGTVRMGNDTASAGGS